MTTTLPLHPTTGLRALGIVGGRPVWPVMGGDGTGTGAPAGGDSGQNGGASGSDGQGQQQGQQSGGSAPPAPPGGAPQQQPPQQGQTGGQQQSGGQGQGGDSDDLANLSQADLAKMVKDLRKENANSRTTGKQKAATEAKQELAQEIGKALGLVNDDSGKAPDPEQLAQQLTGERRERYAEKAARAAGLDGDALLDSRAFADKLGKLDPAANTFDSDLESLVKDYADDPRYKTTSGGQAPPRSGGDFSGGPGNTPTFTREQIARMSASEYAQNREAIMAQLGKSK